MVHVVSKKKDSLCPSFTIRIFMVTIEMSKFTSLKIDLIIVDFLTALKRIDMACVINLQLYETHCNFGKIDRTIYEYITSQQSKKITLP